jgi:TonB family protein
MVIWRAMRVLLGFSLLAAICSSAAAQIQGAMPSDPQAVLATAAPHYDFSSPALKPWHLRLSYQTYDDNGKPAKQGAYEYWWVSPKVYRSTWTRGGQSYSEWHTADGKSFYAGSDMELDFFEYQLPSDLFSPLPAPQDYDASKTYFVKEKEKFGKSKEPCFMIVPKMPQHERILTVPMGLFPSYCFDEKIPALLAKWSFASLTIGFGSLVEFQGLYLPRQILMYENTRPILKAMVDEMSHLSPSDPALIPARDATPDRSESVAIGSGIMAGHRIGGPPPVYPEDAKEARADGTVTLKALIGRDGRIHDMQVVTAPWPSLVASAMWSVSQWKYKPYLLNGEPVEVETTINVIYKLGY